MPKPNLLQAPSLTRTPKRRHPGEDTQLRETFLLLLVPPAKCQLAAETLKYDGSWLERPTIEARSQEICTLSQNGLAAHSGHHHLLCSDQHPLNTQQPSCKPLLPVCKQLTNYLQLGKPALPQGTHTQGGQSFKSKHLPSPGWWTTELPVSLAKPIPTPCSHPFWHQILEKPLPDQSGGFTQTLNPRMKGADGALPGWVSFFPGTGMLRATRLIPGWGGPAARESPGVRREVFLRAPHQYEERCSGCRAKTACFQQRRQK